MIDPSVSLSTAPSTSSVDGWVAVVIAGELLAGAVLMSAAVIPTAEFPGSSASFDKGAELAWSTAAVVADGTATGVRLRDTCCARNASKSGFSDAVEAAEVL